MRASGFGLALRIANASLRHWAARCGYAGTHPGRAAAIAVVLGACTSAALSLWLRTRVGPVLGSAGQLGYQLTWALFLTTFLMSSLVVIVVESSGDEESRILAAIRALPISSWLLAASLNLPIAVALMLVIGFAAPPLVVTVQALTGLPPLPVTVTVLATVAAGGGMGLILISLGRLALAGRPRVKLFAYPASVAVWGLTAAANGWWLQSHITRGYLPLASNLPDTLLFWPAAAEQAFRPSVPAMLVLGVLVLAVMGAALLLYHATIGIGLGVRPIQSVGLKWTSRRNLPLLSLELTRLIRTPRVWASYAAAGVLIVGASGWMLVAGPDGRTTVAQIVILPVSVALAHIPLIARGFSPRQRPQQLRLFLSPARWALAVMGAATLIAMTLGATFLIVLYVFTRSAELVATGLALQVFSIALGAAVGATVHAGKDNAGGEAAGLLAVGIGAIAVSGLLGEVFRSTWSVALGLTLVGLTLLPAPGLVEAGRWRSDTSGGGVA